MQGAQAPAGGAVGQLCEAWLGLAPGQAQPVPPATANLLQGVTGLAPKMAVPWGKVYFKKGGGGKLRNTLVERKTCEKETSKHQGQRRRGREVPQAPNHLSMLRPQESARPGAGGRCEEEGAEKATVMA